MQSYWIPIPNLNLIATIFYDHDKWIDVYWDKDSIVMRSNNEILGIRKYTPKELKSMALWEPYIEIQRILREKNLISKE